MKFILKNSESIAGLRLGIISGIDRVPNFEMETPNVLLHTQGGTVPHLTPDVLQLLSPAPQAILLSIPSLAHIQDRMKETTINIGQFIGLPNLMNMVTLIDPGTCRLEGFHKKDVISIKTRQGIKEYTAESYLDFMGALKPDAFVVLSDGDTKDGSAKKRIEKSMFRSSLMMKRCSELLTKDSPSILVPLEGGNDREKRENYAKEMSQYAHLASGVVIDGLGELGIDLTEEDFQKYKACIQASVINCGIDGVRMIPGPWHIRAVFQLIELGIDLFDTSYPHLVTERGSALILPFNQDLSPAKKSKPSNFEISLKDSSYADAFEPVCSKCRCHCCVNYTKAYIHHLLNVREMTASVLLNIHNLQQYLELFAAIRRSINLQTFQQLKETFFD